MKTYGVGIIGAGFMGKTHTYNYVNMPLFYDGLPFKIRLVGICNRTPGKAEQLKQDFGYEFCTTDYRDLLERKDIDIIDVCTPNNAHTAQIADALAAGKHVYADKPLCVTDEDADDLASRAEQAARTGVVSQVAFHNRFYPAVRKIKSLVDDGFLGDLVSFHCYYYHASNLNPKRSRGWRQDIGEAGGGVLYDMGSHALDLVYHLFGEYAKASMESVTLFPERAGDDGKVVRVETEDHVLINARLRNGAIGTIEASKIILGSNDDLDLDLYGTRGAIRFNLMNPGFVRVYDSRDPDSPIGGMRGYREIEALNKDPDSRSNFPGPRFNVGWLRGHVASAASFVRCVHEGRPASPSIREAAYIQKLMNALYRVAGRGAWIAE
jgi:predicted dehydrogenase